MSWLEITIRTEASAVEDTVAALTAGGFPELVIEDQAEFETFLDENKAYWDYIDEALQEKLQGLSQIKLYLEDTDAAGMEQLKKVLEPLGLAMEVSALAETDWEESWKENYPPQPVGQLLVVLPYWNAGETGGRLPVILDPGLTFGTGAHPSTQMVMENMEQLVQPGDVCLDLGSGSGILSITALRLGAKSAVGVDIDPKAEDIARQNAAYNGFDGDVFTALTGNVTGDKRLMERLSKDTYQMVLVNIVADVIISLAPVLPNFVKKETELICSGILDIRLDDVVAALENAGMTVTEIFAKEDWRCVRAKRRDP